MDNDKVEFLVLSRGTEKCLFLALFVISFGQTQASSGGAARIYAQPKMVKNVKKNAKIPLSAKTFALSRLV